MLPSLTCLSTLLQLSLSSYCHPPLLLLPSPRRCSLHPPRLTYPYSSSCHFTCCCSSSYLNCCHSCCRPCGCLCCPTTNPMVHNCLGLFLSTLVDAFPSVGSVASSSVKHLDIFGAHLYQLGIYLPVQRAVPRRSQIQMENSLAIFHIFQFDVFYFCYLFIYFWLVHLYLRVEVLCVNSNAFLWRCICCSWVEMKEFHVYAIQFQPSFLDYLEDLKSCWPCPCDHYVVLEVRYLLSTCSALIYTFFCTWQPFSFEFLGALAFFLMSPILSSSCLTLKYHNPHHCVFLVVDTLASIIHVG